MKRIKLRNVVPVVAGAAILTLGSAGAQEGTGTKPTPAQPGTGTKAPAAPAAVGTVKVMATDLCGRPISGAKVQMSAGGRTSTGVTTRAGTVMFSGVPAGAGSVVLLSHEGGRSSFNVKSGGAVVMKVEAGTNLVDFNNDNLVDHADISDFVGAFFAGLPSADMNHDGLVNSQDYFDFLNMYFSDCGVTVRPAGPVIERVNSAGV